MAQGKEIGSTGLGQDPSNIAADGLTRAQSSRTDISGVVASTIHNQALDDNANDITGIFPNGFTTSAIQEAIDWSKNLGIVVVNLHPGAEYTYDAPITIDLAYTRLNGNGATIFADSVGVNEKVLTVDYNPPVSGGYRNLWADVRPIQGLSIINRVGLYQYPGSTLPSGSVGIYFNGTDVVAGIRPSLRNVLVSGFETLIDGKDRWYLAKFYDCTFHNFNIAVRQQAGLDAGENISYYGCTWTQGNLAFHLLDGSSEHFLYGCSIDYTNQLVVSEGSPSRLHLSQCHVEPRGASVGGDPTSTSILLGNGSDPRAAVSTRDSFIDMDGNGSYFRMSGGWFDPNNGGGTGPYAYTNLVKLRSKSAYAVFDGVAMDNMANTSNCFWTGDGNCVVYDTQVKHSPSGAGMPTRITDQSRGQLLRDGNFDDGSFPDLWYVSRDTATVTSRLTGTNITIARSTAQAYNASGSLLMTKVGAGNGRISVLVPIRKRSKISVFGRVYRPSSGGSTGNLFVEARWANVLGLDSNGVPIVISPDSPLAKTAVQLTNTTNAWTEFALQITESTGTPSSQYDVAPEWATHIRVVVNGDALTAGATYFDDVWISSW